MEKDEEIIMQIKINRQEDDFDLIKMPLSYIEELSLDNFLQSYLDSKREQRKDIISQQYFSEDE